MSPEFEIHPSSNNEYDNGPTSTDELVEAIGGTAVGAVKNETDRLPSMVGHGPYGPYGMNQEQIEATNQRLATEAAETARIEAIKILDKDTFTLGDLNPLINPTDLTRKESVDAVRYTTFEKIRSNQGLEPKVLESTVVTDPESGNFETRFVARFETDHLTEEQLVMLEDLVKQTYGLTVRTRTDSKGNDIPAQSYLPTQLGEELRSKTGGWYMGPDPLPNSGLHKGLYLFKDYGPINKKNFLDDSQTPRKFIIEVREASQYQTDLVTFITQISVVLSQEKLLDRGQLLYETYYDLMRLGIKKTEESSIYGMEEAADMIRRELIIPLASPEISKAINQEPQSVLMVGVPGTGKTLLVERLLQQETGLFVLPIDPFELQTEVAKPKDKQTLMPRIAEVARITGKRVILHVDDIENMVGETQATNSTMLNLMAGVQESGFYIIASTNYPEKINSSLIQPQRFSVLIHCGLQNEQARYEILKIHADAESKKEKRQLFASEEVRDIFLQVVASHTEAFTPRYLANVATIAKSFLVDRIARSKEQTIGLTEEDLDGDMFTLEDWDKALREVSKKYNSKEIKRRNDELSKFVIKQMEQNTGFSPDNMGPSRIFADDVYARVEAAQAELKKKEPVVVNQAQEPLK
jgi:ATP-dependent 26S proteasome regulatory subunit